MSTSDILNRLLALGSGDLPVHGGRTLAYVYDSGHPEIDDLARRAVAAFAGANALDPTAFPSLLAMENDLVGFAAELLMAPDSVVGSVTSGGTESCLLAVQAARDARPELTTPSMVLPDTAHAAFHKAAHYFGVRPVSVATGPDHRADPVAMAAAIDDSTVLVVGSAPSYAHGVVDPIADLAAAAADRGVRCHVDACIGGWVLPYAARLGRPVTPWTFAVPGVTSISVDLHKYAYAPKGASLLLHRDPGLRLPQFFASAAWPGYTMLNPTMASTRSGGPLAGAWAVVQALGDHGYQRLATDTFAAVDAIVAGTADIAGLHLVAHPDATLIAIGTDSDRDPFTVCDQMRMRGWYVQPQLSFRGRPANIHLSISAATCPHVPEFLTALAESAAAAAEAGPVVVDPGVAAMIPELDPRRLSDSDFTGLLAAAGLTGDGLLPQQLAPVNALLDLATPELREAVLVRFLDQISRPRRPHRSGQFIDSQGTPTTSPRTL